MFPYKLIFKQSSIWSIIYVEIVWDHSESTLSGMGKEKESGKEQFRQDLVYFIY